MRKIRTSAKTGYLGNYRHDHAYTHVADPLFQSLKSRDKPDTDARSKIIDIFKKNVYGKIPDTKSSDPKHDGKVGHWLEIQMGKNPDASNTPDFFGYEMKTQTSGVLTLGSWDPNYWIFNNPEKKINREGFLQAFGKPNPNKKNRMSWSGSPVPKIDGINDYGMRITIGEDAIRFFYSYSDDRRDNKENVVPEHLRLKDLEICRWNFSGNKSLREKVENKYNQQGWFICLRGQDGRYSSLGFGNPFNFDTFLKLFRDGLVYFDSGMYKGNPRNYCQWRASNTFWDTLITDRITNFD